MSISGKKNITTQRLRHVNDLQGQRKVLAFQNVHFLGASVECFMKAHSMSNRIFDMPHLWWQKAPMWFLFKKKNHVIQPL